MAKYILTSAVTTLVIGIGLGLWTRFTDGGEWEMILATGLILLFVSFITAIGEES